MRDRNSHNNDVCTAEIPLSAMCPGETVRVERVERCELFERLRDIGIVKDTCVTCLYKAPLGDPAAYLIRGAVIALRHSDAEHVIGTVPLGEGEA